MLKRMPLDPRIAVSVAASVLILACAFCLAEEKKEDKGTKVRVFSADDEEHKGQIERLMEQNLPEGYTLEVEYREWWDGSQIYRGYSHVRATSLNPDGVIDGKVRYWEVSGGLLREVPYEEGKRQGAERVWSRGGHLEAVIPWEDDQVHGERIGYHSNGKVSARLTYKNGKAIGESILYASDESVRERASYKDGKRHGKRIQYWPDSEEAVRRIIPYREGLVHGVVRELYPDGTIRRELGHRTGEIHGIEVSRDEDGNETRRRYWLNGDIVTRGKFEAEYEEETEE